MPGRLGQLKIQRMNHSGSPCFPELCLSSQTCTYKDRIVRHMFGGKRVCNFAFPFSNLGWLTFLLLHASKKTCIVCLSTTCFLCSLSCICSLALLFFYRLLTKSSMGLRKESLFWLRKNMFLNYEQYARDSSLDSTLPQKSLQEKNIVWRRPCDSARRGTRLHIPWTPAFQG